MSCSTLGIRVVEILNRTASGIQLARWLEAPHIEVWTVEHFHLEVAKVLRRYVLAGELDDIEAGRRVALLAQWELDVARVAPLLVDAWSMRHNVTLHDALYVALARQLDATLLTADRKLAAAPGLDVRTRTAHLKLTVAGDEERGAHDRSVLRPEKLVVALVGHPTPFTARSTRRSLRPGDLIRCRSDSGPPRGFARRRTTSRM